MPDRQHALPNDAIVESISKQVDCPKPVVRRIYEEQLVRLRSRARLTEYLTLFAARRTRELLVAARRQGRVMPA